MFYEEKEAKQALGDSGFEANVVEKVRAGISYTATAGSGRQPGNSLEDSKKKYEIKAPVTLLTLPGQSSGAAALSSRPGMSVAEVGEAMGLSGRSAEKLLRNGRFTSPRTIRSVGLAGSNFVGN